MAVKASSGKPAPTKTRAKAKTVSKASAPKAKAATPKKAAAPKKASISKKASAPKAKTSASKPKVSAPKTKAIKPSSVKPRPAKVTMAELQTQLSRLESRLKRGQTDTQNIVAAMEARFTDLAAQSKKVNATQKANLTRQVNRLTGQLTAMTDDVRRNVEVDLKSALENPNDLVEAVSRANSRMDSAEAAQADALRKVNLHLAHMARAVEARLDEQQIRINQIETETAGALTDVGTKIESLSEKLNTRRNADHLMISEKVNELALETQTQLEGFKQNLETRVERLEVTPDNDERFERLAYQLDRINARIESVEHDLSNVADAQADIHNLVETVQPVQAYHMQQVPAPQAMPQPVAAPMPAPMVVGGSVPPNVAPSNVVPMQDAFTPQPIIEPVEARESHEPVEFDPNAFAPAAPPTAAPMQAPTMQNKPVMAPPPQQPQQSMPAGPVTLNTPPPAAAPQYAGADYINDDMPFADPAYAEQDEMRAQRIGVTDGGGGLKERLKSLPLSGRNLRVAGMALGVCVVGLLVGKTVLGVGQDRPMPQTDRMVEQVQPGLMAQPAAAMPSVETLPPIGEYQDSQAPDLNAAKATTLAAAADAGNPIAQFQLGLAKLQQNNVTEGVQLIRLAANKNLPAAQYRLAKLYEAGQGVTADPAMARKLTEQAARAGNRIAMHDLALYYTDGRGGVDKDIAKAVGWFNQAAERGVVDSQFNLAVLSESGQGTAASQDNAYFWYAIAASQGDQYAQKRIDVLDASMTPEQVAPIKARIKAFKPKPIDEAANGIFKNVPWAAPKSSDNVRITQVRQVQTMLSDLGYNIGGADGSYGPKTKAAIIEFERLNSLPETGEITPMLLEKLELAAGA